MRRRHWPVCFVQCVLCLWGTLGFLGTLAGCGRGGSDPEDPDDGLPSLSIVSDEIAGSKPLLARRAGGLNPPAHADKQPVPFAKTDLELGRRFPLLRTVEQTLTQSTSAGLVASRSRLECLLTLTVEETQADGRTRFGVDYQRVRYARNLAGQTLEYDSDNPDPSVAAAVGWYRGLANNGFSFWMERGHQVSDLVGVEDFLKRCMGHVPHADGMEDFVVDSVGLLPVAVERDETGTPRKLGDSWMYTRDIRWPVSMHVRNRYTLKQLDDTTADIEFVGTVTPAVSLGGPDPEAEGVQVTLRSGRSFGTCRLRRGISLPIESHVEYLLDMGVHSPDGAQFTQQKKIVSMVQALEPQVVSGTGRQKPDARGREADLSSALKKGTGTSQNRLNAKQNAVVLRASPLYQQAARGPVEGRTVRLTPDRSSLTSGRDR